MWFECYLCGELYGEDENGSDGTCIYCEKIWG